MTAFLDARSVPNATSLTPDLAIVGGGPAGISLALALADSGLSILLLESGGTTFDPRTQALYAGEETGVRYVPLDAGRLRYLGGATNHWGGWSRPLDAIDFETRKGVAYTGWPVSLSDLEPYFPRAQELIECSTWAYDRGPKEGAEGTLLPLAPGGVSTTWFQFSKTRDSTLPTHFGERYASALKAAAKITPMMQANVTAIRLSQDGKKVERLDVATLSGNSFTVKPRFVVLAAGAVEIARLMLASNDVMKTGVGNANDMVGRFFADHPIPRDVATLVVFDGKLDPIYGNAMPQPGTPDLIMRAALSPSAAFMRAHGAAGSLTTVENAAPLDTLGTAAVVATAQALRVDASRAKAWSLGCGMEMTPDPDRRLTLSDARDPLGMPRLKLNMTISDDDFAHFRLTLAELGRQLLAAKTGMIRLSYNSRAQWLAAMDWGNHHMGTTRMSADPRTGVVDANSMVHGIGNLFVAGSSVFTTYGSSNPTLNLVALALRLGDHLKKVTA